MRKEFIVCPKCKGDGKIKNTGAAVWLTLGEMLKAAREKKELSQAEIGRQLGLSRAAVCMIEQGRQRIGVDQLSILAQALEIPINDLFAPFN